MGVAVIPNQKSKSSFSIWVSTNPELNLIKLVGLKGSEVNKIALIARIKSSLLIRLYSSVRHMEWLYYSFANILATVIDVGSRISIQLFPNGNEMKNGFHCISACAFITGWNIGGEFTLFHCFLIVIVLVFFFFSLHTFILQADVCGMCTSRERKGVRE